MLSLLDGLTSNADTLVAMAVCGYVSQPSLRPGHYTHYPDGKGVILPGMFGVVYNAKVGDRAFGWAGDHVEPGVSIAHPDEKCDFALHYLTCIGNEATVMSGLARGAKGVVTGEHARLLVDFPDEVNDLLPVVVDELRKATATITEEEVIRVRNQIRAGLLMSLESPSSRAGQLARQQILWGRVIPLQETVDRINRITVDRVKQVADQIFAGDRLSLASVGPVEKLPDFDTIASYINN